MVPASDRGFSVLQGPLLVFLGSFCGSERTLFSHLASLQHRSALCPCQEPVHTRVLLVGVFLAGPEARRLPGNRS